MQAPNGLDAAAALLVAALLLSGCGEGGVAGGLRSAGVVGTPDEFLVLPTKPLEMPDNLSALPPPEPGTPNLVDYRPRLEAVVGLTGRRAAAGTASGAALVARVGPSAPDIRLQLAQEDAVYRDANQGLLLERLFARNREALVYSGMTLDSAAEFERLRARGLRVPPAPPALLAQ